MSNRSGYAGRAGRVDDNQRAIVDAFRACGWSVLIVSQLGKGAPDLVVGKNARNLLVEVKNGAAGLSDDETTWWTGWRGQVCIVRTVEDVAALTVEANKAAA